MVFVRVARRVATGMLLVNELRAIRTLWRDSQFRSLAKLSLIAIATGTVFYTLVEHLRLVDALYFSVSTLMTVGFGDFSPETDAGKLFTVFYVFVGAGILLAFVTRVATQVVESHANAVGRGSKRVAPLDTRRDRRNAA
jgi:voltage-gated potassium channel Kch